MQAPARRAAPAPFDAACLELASRCLPSQRDYQLRVEALQEMQYVLHHGLDWGREGLTPPVLEPFGSFPSGAFSAGSDLDVGLVTHKDGVPGVGPVAR